MKRRVSFIFFVVCSIGILAAVAVPQYQRFEVSTALATKYYYLTAPGVETLLPGCTLKGDEMTPIEVGPRIGIFKVMDAIYDEYGCALGTVVVLRTADVVENSGWLRKNWALYESPMPLYEELLKPSL